MKLSHKILFVCVPLAILNAICGVFLRFGDYDWISEMLVRDAGVLLAVLSFVLSRKVLRRDAKFVYLNFVVFFSINSLNSTVQVMMHWLHVTDVWSVFYYFQYNLLSYYLLLAFSVIYLVVDFAFRKRRAYQKYLITMMVVGSSWGYLFYPYFVDPKYLYTTKDIQAYRAIRDAIHELEEVGKCEPTVGEIASVVEFRSPEGRKEKMTTEDRQAYVAEVVPYLRGDDHIPLVDRPLFWAGMTISAVCVLFILCLVLYQYLADPPEGAYVEKFVWFVLLFCGFEVLHNYAFAMARTYATLTELSNTGHYISFAVMVILVFLFVVRLRFLQSVEGKYYERQLVRDASHVTRWRDAFDNWVLRRFMNPGELHRRFLIRSKSGMARHTLGKE